MTRKNTTEAVKVITFDGRDFLPEFAKFAAALKAMTPSEENANVPRQLIQTSNGGVPMEFDGKSEPIDWKATRMSLVKLDENGKPKGSCPSEAVFLYALGMGKSEKARDLRRYVVKYWQEQIMGQFPKKLMYLYVICKKAEIDVVDFFGIPPEIAEAWRILSEYMLKKGNTSIDDMFSNAKSKEAAELDL